MTNIKKILALAIILIIFSASFFLKKESTHQNKLIATKGIKPIPFTIPNIWDEYRSNPEKWINHEGVLPYRPNSYLEKYKVQFSQRELTISETEKLLRLVIAANDTLEAIEPQQRHYISPKCDLFKLIAKQYPDAVTITSESGDIVWTDDLANFARQKETLL